VDSLDRSIAGIYSELNLATGSAEVVQRLGVEIRGLVQASGDPDLARRTLDAVTSRDAKAAFDDYWWDYPLGALRQRDVLMRELRGGLP